MMKEGFYICKQCKRCAFRKERFGETDVCVYFRELTELFIDMGPDTTYEEWNNKWGKKIDEQWDRECPYHLEKEESWEILRQYIDNGRR